MLAKIIIEMIRKSNKLELFNALCSFSSLTVNLAEVLLLTSLHLFLYFLFFSSFFFSFLVTKYRFLAPHAFPQFPRFIQRFLPQIYMQFMQRKERGGEGEGERERKGRTEKKKLTLGNKEEDFK